MGFKKRCPKCGSPVRSRIQRKSWMRAIPMSKHYECSECFADYVVAFGIFRLTVK